MNFSDDRLISDELLSAYLDNAVTPQERQLVEAAAAQSADVAWRLESLRQTVQLLHALPEVPLPRSFALRVEQVQELPAAGTTPPTATLVPAPRASVHSVPQPSGWQRFLAGWHAFWDAGNLTLRNAAAVSLALFLVLLIGGAVTNVGGMTPTGTMATAPMSAPAAEPEIVALAAPPSAERAAPAVGPAAADGEAAPLSPPGADETPGDATAYVAPEQDAAMARMALPDIGAPAPVGPMAAPDVPGLLMAPGGLGMGGGAEMGGGGLGGDRAGGAPGGGDSSLLPPEAYMTSPDEAVIIEPSPSPGEAAPQAAARMADAAADEITMQESVPADAVEAAEPSPDVAKRDDSVVEGAPSTPAAVALVPPAATHQPTDAAYPAVQVEPGEPSAPGLPLLAIAQAGGALLTVLFASLWWRSRSRRTTG